MQVSRRDFLRVSVGAGAGTAIGGMVGLGLPLAPARARAQELRIKDAKVVPSICPFCSVGCATLIHVKDEKIVNIEGDPRSPHNEGTLCPKGAAIYQLHVNPNRATKVLHRKPGATDWEVVELEWAMDRVADLIKETRDETFIESLPNGKLVNMTPGIFALGGATLDIELNHVCQKFWRGLGVVAIENQARIRHSSSVPGLGTRFGRGAATLYPRNLEHTDCFVVMGSNMAECHPVAFRWPMKAKLNGAKLVHVDPRFTRTSAVADLHVPIRAGSDIAFLGGLINYVVNSKRWNTDPFFKEFAVNYTNAATIIGDDFKDTEDLDGVFSGMVKFTEPAFWPYNGLEGRYDNASWAYKRGPKPLGPATKDLIAKRAGPPFDDLVRSLKPGPAEKDPTLQNPHCVLQILKRHFARYTPEMVEQVCGSPKDKFIKVAEMLLENSGRDRTSAFAYAVAWTQHTYGVQMISCCALLQLLLGNIGRPGAGVMALRGHAAIQGSTDVPTLYHSIHGYMNAPSALRPHETLRDYMAAETSPTSYYGNTPKFLVSYLKSMYGAAATAENDFGYDWHPKILGDHSHIAMFSAMEIGRAHYPGEPDALKILREINGYQTADPKQHLKGFAELKDDGSTTCASWIYCGCYPAWDQNLTARREPDPPGVPGAHLKWGWAWPANRRVMYNRASADLRGNPWSERKRWVWWDPTFVNPPDPKTGVAPPRGEWVGYDVPDFAATKAPDAQPKPDGIGLDALSGSQPFIMRGDGRGWLFVPTGLVDGPLPTNPV